MSGNGHLAAAVQPGKKATFRFNANTGWCVFKLRQQGEEVIIVFAAFNADGPLPHSGQKRCRVKGMHEGHAEPQAVQPGRGQHNGVVNAFLQLAQARIHIAAQAFNAQIRAQGKQLRLTPQAAGANARALRQSSKIGIAAGKQAIGGGLPWGHASKHQPRGQLHV